MGKLENLSRTMQDNPQLMNGFVEELTNFVMHQFTRRPSTDIANFEYEARVKVFYNLAPLNERSKNLPELNKLLVKLGFSKQQSEI